MNLNDHMSLYSTSIVMNLSYIVQFNQDSHPAKQDIAIIASSSQRTAANDMFGIIPITIYGEILIDIKSNSFTWADDIIRHVSNYIDSKFKRPSAWVKILLASRELYILAMFPLFIILTLVTDYLGLAGNSKLALANELRLRLIENGAVDLVSISNKIDALINYEIGISPSAQRVLALLGVSFGVALGMVMIVLIKYFTKGKYVSINGFSEKLNFDKEKRKSIILYGGLATAAFSILTGLFSTAIWEYCFK